MDHMGEYKGAKYDMKLGVHEFTSFIVLLTRDRDLFILLKILAGHEIFAY